MKDKQQKRNLNFVSVNDKYVNGNIVRKSYVQDITEDAPIYPKPLEVSDIDDAFRQFVEKDLGLTIDGKDVKTFTLFSNQRFSEYSQTWSHSDDDGNILLNFKTINRETNSNGQDNQGGLWNIPGDRFYTLLERTVLEDDGSESLEVYSMRQPYTINLNYRVNFVTDLYENLTTFNEMVNRVFRSRQFYIRPNDHYIPLILSNIEDTSKYSVDSYRLYTQTVKITALAYIIHEDDIRVQKVPKVKNISFVGDKKNKVTINLEEGDELENQTISLGINFKEWHDSVEFAIDTDFDVNETLLSNIRSMRLHVNDVPIYWEKGFKVKDGDVIRIKINQYDIRDTANITFNGFNPNVSFEVNVVNEDVSKHVTKHIDIEISD